MVHHGNWRATIIVIGTVAGCAPASPPSAPVSKPTTPPPSSPSPLPQVETSSQPGQTAAIDSPLEPTFVPEQIARDSGPETPDGSDSPFALEEGFTLLSLSDFEPFQAEPDTWTRRDDGVRCTGKPKGYLSSLASHQNFTWKLEYRFDRPKSLKDAEKFKGNTGFLVYLIGEHKLWPVCLEVQGKHSQMAAIKENGGAEPVVVQDDDAARQTARKPAGEWNRLEIVSRDGSIAVNLNDVPISRSEPNFLSEGKIGIQAEDYPFVVRRMRIRDE